MAETNARIGVDVETSEALAKIKQLQREISIFHSSMARGGAAAAAASSKLQQSLMNSVNATRGFSAEIVRINSTAESFTNALEKNKLSMGQYFRFAGASTKTFGKLFKNEFATINKVARERVKDLQAQYIKMGRDASGSLQAIKVRPLALDMNNLGTQTAMAAQKVQLFNQLVTQGSTNLLNWGKNTQWAGRQLMVGFTIPLTIMGATAAREFMAIEKQAIRFRRVYGEMFTTSAETEKAIEQVRELADEFTKYGIAVEKTLEIAADAAQMGLMGADLTAQVSEATRLAVLGEVEQQEALETTISVTNAFGVAAEDLAGKIDFLNAVENQTMVAISDLTVAIPKAGPVVQQLGGDVEDLAFFLAAMREGGINASEGANALKSGLARIINPTEKASEMLGQLGINITGIVEGNAGDIRGTIIQLGNALNELDPLNRARAIEELFGKFQFARISTLFQNITKEGSQAARVLDLTQQSTEELAVLSERELKNVEDSPVFKFEKALEKIQTALAPIGEAFLKAVTPVIEFGTKILEKFNNMSDGAKQFIVSLTAISGVVAPALLMVIGLVANGAANLIKFAQLVARYFGMAQASSNVLGDQTDYLTQQQAEQLAVAASLDQAHSSLVQTFTAESSAVQALTRAYEKAALAQGNYANQARNAATAGSAATAASGVASAARGAASAGTSRYNPFTPPKYAEGILSVPGPKGAGDVVAAMLSPGEAVIPADVAEQYRPFIQEMISGNIPGFNQGGIVKAGDNTYKIASARSAPGIQSRIDRKELGVDIVEEAFRRLASEAFAAGEAMSVTATSFAETTRNILREKGQGPTSKAHLTMPLDPESAVAKGAYDAVGWGGMSEDYQQHTYVTGNLTAELDDQLNRQLRERSASPEFFEREWFGRKNKLKSAAEEGGFQFADADSENTLAFIEDEIGNEALKELEEQKRIAIAKGESADNIQMSDEMLSAATDRVIRRYEEQESALGDLTRALRKRANQAGQARASMPRSVLEQGIKDGRIVQAEGTRQYNEVDPKTGKVLATNIARVDPNSTAQSIDVTGGAKPYTRTKIQSERLSPEETQDRINTQRAQRKSAEETSSAAKKTAAAADKTKAAAEKTEAASQESLEASQVQQQAAAEDLEAANMEQAAARKELSEGGSGSTTPVATPRRRRGGAALSGGLFAAGSVAMGASFMGGPVGDVAGAVAGPLMAVGGLLPILGKLGPVAQGATLAIGLLAYGAYKLIDSFKKTASRVLELEQALGRGKKAMDVFAEFSGSVTASQIMERRRAQGIDLFQVAPGKKTQGQVFVESEQGNELLENVQQGILEFGKDATINKVFMQLGQAVASGALDTASAMSIASEIGAQLDDLSFGISVNSKLIQLLDPTGADLLVDPIELQAKINILGQEDLESLISEGPKTMAESWEEGSKMMADSWEAYGMGAILRGDWWEGFLRNDMLTGWFFNQQDNVARMAEVIGAANNQLQSLSSEIDTIDVEFGKKIEEAIERGDSAAYISQLRDQQIDAREEAILRREKAIETALAERATDPGKFDLALKESLSQMFEGDALNSAEKLFSRIEGVIGEGDKAAELQFLMTTGDVPLSTITSILDDWDARPSLSQKRLELATSFDRGMAQEIESVLSLLEDPELQEDYLNIFDPNNLEQSTKDLKALTAIARVTANTLGGQDVKESMISAYVNGPGAQEARKRLEDDLAKAEQLSNQEIYQALEQEVFGAEAFAIAQLMWDQVVDGEEKDALYTILTVLDADTTGAYDDLLGLEGQEVSNVLIEDKVSAMAAQTSQYLTTARAASGAVVDDFEEMSDGGGGAQKLSSIMDDLVKKLRDVRLNQILMTNGWVESANKLEELFGGGRGISVFSGLEQDMRRLGAGEDLISLIAGMDPEEFEKKKDQLFTFDAAGNITGATNILVNMGKALNAIALGDFQSEQERVIRTTNNQIIATRKLVAAGLSQAAAYEAVQDAAFAAAIAQEKNTDVIRQLVKVTKEAKEMTEAFAAAQAVASSNQSFIDRGKAIDFIAKNIENLTEAQKQLIMNDSNVQALIGTTVDAKALRQALANAEKEADLELKIKKLTFEGQIDIFEEGFSNAMEAFATKEKEIELDFKIKKQPLIDAIEAAEQQIQDIRNRPGGLDDLEADLQRISSKEEEVNEKYDDRIEALEEVKSIQEAIAKLQASQLDVAEALSRGDIAAAARAAQQARQDAASRAIDNQTKQIELQRENELGQLTAESGMTREQIEENIKNLKDQIFEIEEKTLEPAQYRLDLLEREQQELVEGLTVLGKTRDEWERVKNNVDLAKISTDEFQQSMQEALDIVDDIVNYWNDFDPEPKEIEIREVRVKTPEELEPSAIVEPRETNDGNGGGELDIEPPPPVPENYGDGSLLMDPNAPNIPYGLTPSMYEMFVEYGRSRGTADLYQYEDPAKKGQMTIQEDNRSWLQKTFPNSPLARDLSNLINEIVNPAVMPGASMFPDSPLREFDNLFGPGKTTSGTATFGKARGEAPEKGTLSGLPLGGGTGGYDPLTGRYNPQSTMSLPGGPPGIPPALSGGQDFNAIASQITDGLSAKLQQVENDTAETTRVMLQHFGQFGVTAPILMQAVPNFINSIPEKSRSAILDGMQSHFSILSANVQQTLQDIPDFFTRLPEVTQEAIIEQMNSQFGQFSNQALTDLGGINDWILKLPEEAQESAWGILAEQISRLGIDAEGNLNETILKFFDVLPANVQGPIIDEIGSHIQTMAQNAGVSIEEYVERTLTDLPESTKDAIVSGMEDNFTIAADNSGTIVEDGVGGGLTMVGAKSVSVAEGMEKDFETASGSAVEDVESIKTPFEELAAYISDDGEDGFTGIMNKAFENAKIGGVAAANGVKSAFGSAGREFASEFSKKFSQLLDKLEGVRVDGEKIDIDRNGFNKGGLVPGVGNTDIVPASLTPGEFVITKFATRNFGVENLQAINDGKFPIATIDSQGGGEIRYNNNYEINVNVKSESNPDDIARTVVQSIKRVDSQRIRGNRL